MANVNQIYEIVNSIAKQSLGMTGLTSTNASFVSVGEKVFESDKNVEAWNKALIDRIARTAISIREYKGDTGELRKEGIEWGMALQKIYIDIPEAEKNTTWITSNEEHSDPFRKRPLRTDQLFYSSMTAWEFDGTIPDIQMKTAFLSPERWGAYVSGIHIAMNNSVELAYENMTNLCRAAFIARNMSGAINLLEMYNAETESELKVANALRDKEFLRYASCEINRYVDRLGRMSTKFNRASYKTHTPSDELGLTMHADFSTAAKFYLASDTFHKDLVSLPHYKSVPYWQAAGEGSGYAFDDTSAISVKLSSTNTITQSGIICVMYDVEGMGTTIDNRRMKVSRHELDEYTTYAAKAEVGYYNELHSNAVIFYIADKEDESQVSINALDIQNPKKSNS